MQTMHEINYLLYTIKPVSWLGAQLSHSSHEVRNTTSLSWSMLQTVKVYHIIIYDVVDLIYANPCAHLSVNIFGKLTCHTT